MQPTVLVKHAPLLSRQKYAVPTRPEAGSTEDFIKATSIICEHLEFHEMLAKLGIKAIINPDWSVVFGSTDDRPLRTKYSRMLKAIWDCPQFRAVMDDYGIRLMNMHTHQYVA